jgi:hypothetical protein
MRLLVLLALALSAAAETITPADYLQRIDRLADLLEQRAPALTAAGALERIQVAWPAATLAADPVLPALVRAGRRGEALRHARALHAAVAAGVPAAAEPDRSRLAELAAGLPPPLSAGGSLLAPQVAVELDETWRQRLTRALEWLADRWLDFWRWLKSWFVNPEHHDEGEATRTVVLVALGVLGVLLVALALLALRRRGSPAAAAMAASGPAADHDPISRPSAGWIARAEELAAAGLHREAVRAWYHAVLAAAFASGRLHHRTGRTNWEYLAAVDPAAPWRPPLRELTVAFDRAWYGGRADAAGVAAAAAGARGLIAALEEG